MDISKHLSPNQILLGVQVKDKWELIDLMIDAISKAAECTEPQIVKQIRPGILKREKEHSTGIGSGYAFPHARIPNFPGFAACIAVLKDDLDYESDDGKPVRVACMVLTPEENPTVGIKIMGAVAGLLSDEAVKSFFLNADDPQKIYEYIRDKHLNIENSITAKNIMREPIPGVHAETPLKDVTRIMFNNRVDAVAVEDHENKIIGEITCDLLFKKGVPDFFNQLNNVAFIKDFDPFEKYFEEEAHAIASDVMRKEFAAVDVDATLMEIVYLLSVRNYSKVYVVTDGVIVGTIDRIAVLDRILNY